MRIVLPRLANSGVIGAPGGRGGELVSRSHDLAARYAPDLIVFPELAVCGYPGLVDAGADESALTAVAEPMDGPTVAAFSAFARQTGCAVVYGLCEIDPVDGARYNSVVWSDPDGTSHGYRKIHLTQAERQYWTPGSQTGVARTSLGRVGLSSCYDKMFPNVYQRQRERGAVLSVIASAWSSYREGPDDIWADHAELFDRIRAAETGMVVVSANYEGAKTPGSADSFCGGRRIVDGLGRLLPPTEQDADADVWDVDLDGSAADVRDLNGGDFFVRDRVDFD